MFPFKEKKKLNLIESLITNFKFNIQFIKIWANQTNISGGFRTTIQAGGLCLGTVQSLGSALLSNLRVSQSLSRFSVGTHRYSQASADSSVCLLHYQHSCVGSGHGTGGQRGAYKSNTAPTPPFDKTDEHFQASLALNFLRPSYSEMTGKKVSVEKSKLNGRFIQKHSNVQRLITFQHHC